MSRYDELLNLVPADSKGLLTPTIEQIVFLEGRLEELKKLPFIEVHPTNPVKQRSTPASKQYKEFLQQYINCIKAVEYVIYKDKRLEGEEVEESPLRTWFKNHANTE